MTHADWLQANHHVLMAALQGISTRLQRCGTQPPEATPSARAEDFVNWQAIAPSLSPPPAIIQISQTFGLSDFERDILLLCAGMELMGGWGDLCAAAQSNSRQTLPTFALAQAVLPSPHWSAFLPASPLRHWQLVELGPSNSLLATPLRLDERILHGLLGFDHLDHRLVNLVREVAIADPLVPSHQAIVTQLVAAWKQAETTAQPPMIQLCGPDRSSQQAIAAAACRTLGYRLYALSSRALPTQSQDLQQLIRLWQRETRLGQVALVLDWDQLSSGDASRDNAVNLVSEAMEGPLLVLSRDRKPSQRPTLTYDIHNPTRQEQIHLWHHSLPEADALNGWVTLLTNQFDLTTNQIQAASIHAQSHTTTTNADMTHHLWMACRLQARPQLDDLAQRLTPRESWEDLVLPESQKHLLREIVVHVKQRSQVYEEWGFSQRSNRGLGISGLFAGVSGTGKTMAASVLAKELDLDLYCIDLSSVVSKYIGETEKNLCRVFDAADSGGVILLFDEADALFGKRSDVKDSHDRYANMEVSYLLQRMEAYRGLAILTTNLKDAIDPAFLRRIRFIVRFPFPDPEQRLEIWQRVFPPNVPTQNLNYSQLAKLNVAGGIIRNIALSAAFLAAAEGSPVTMNHLLNAAQREFTKLERPLPPAEIRGWMH